MKVCICSIVKLTWILYFWADTSLHLLPLTSSIERHFICFIEDIFLVNATPYFENVTLTHPVQINALYERIIATIDDPSQIPWDHLTLDECKL